MVLSVCILWNRGGYDRAHPGGACTSGAGKKHQCGSTAGQREGYGVLSDPFHGGAVSRLSGHFGTGTALSAGRSERRSDASAGACF